MATLQFEGTGLQQKSFTNKMQRVYVQNRDGEPLMPTERCGAVRRWLRDKKAKLPEWKGYLYMDDNDKILHRDGKICIPAKDYLRENWEIVEEKKTLNIAGVHNGKGFYFEKDVKEFIKDIKEDVEKAFAKGCADIDPEETDVAPLDDKEVIDIINKRAGERLI